VAILKPFAIEVSPLAPNGSKALSVARIEHNTDLTGNKAKETV